jgi:hypothetical protein
MMSRSVRVIQHHLAMFLVGLYIILGNLIICYMSGSKSVMDITFLALETTRTVPLLIAIFLAWVLIVGVLTDGIRPFLKKFAALEPEKVNMFARLSTEARQYIHDNQLFNMSEFDSVTENATKKSLAQFNHQLVYLAKRIAEYHHTGDMLVQADHETDLYTLFAVASIGMTVQSATYLVSSVYVQLQGPDIGPSFLLATFCIYFALSVLFTHRAKISMLHGFFHANNLLNDLPYLGKVFKK